MTEAERAVIEAAVAWRCYDVTRPHGYSGLWMFGGLARAIDALNAERAAAVQEVPDV